MRTTQPSSSRQLHLEGAFAAALAVADPKKIVPEYLAKIFPAGNLPQGRCLVVGAGKASAAMASALEAYAKTHWPDTPIDGLVITRYGHASPTQRITIVEAGHPVPDQAGMDGAAEVLRLVNTLQSGDTLIALVSGGGSSLLTLPQPGITIDDMRKYLGVHGRPILGTIVKPKMGLTSAEYAEVAYDFWAGGGDFVKNDEPQADQDFCHYDRMVRHVKQAMDKANPKYVLRNYLAQIAIDKAQNKDFSEVKTLLEILHRPFDEQPEHEQYAALPPDWAAAIEVSCSS